MQLTPTSDHLAGEKSFVKQNDNFGPLEVDTFGGKLHIEWDPEAAVTPIGQLPFFIQFLKIGGRFEPWVEDCPLQYRSNNAPEKIDLLGSLLLSILSGHTRYAHISSLISDSVNADLLGMRKIVSDDSACRGLKKIEETAGIGWLQDHLYRCYEPLLTMPWILDADVTVKPLYGKQEGAVLGYNPKKTGRPSHTYHTYLIANLRLVLDVEVLAGDNTHSNHSLPGLMRLLDKLPQQYRPQFIRGDCDWGHERVIHELECKGHHYLFKLKKTDKVKALITKQHGLGEWTYFNDRFEAKEAYLQLQGWCQARRVVLIRKRVFVEPMVAIEHEQTRQQPLAFIDGPENIKVYEYAVLVTNLESDVVSLVQHYRERADCENYFDEIKNQWGWGGFTTRDMKSCRLMARIIALIYNWWTLFVRLANPEHHLEAVTSRPLLLSSVGRLIYSGRQKRMVLTTQHGKAEKIRGYCKRIADFFNDLKVNAPQLTIQQRWCRILAKAMETFLLKMKRTLTDLLPAPS